MQNITKLTMTPLLNSEMQKQQQFSLSIIKTSQKGEFNLIDLKKETTFLLLSGVVKFEVNHQEFIFSRKNVFDEPGGCLSISKNLQINGFLEPNTEMLVIQKENTNNFGVIPYFPKDIEVGSFGKNMWGNTAQRTVRTYFDYTNAPFSNLVVGEIINNPGNWTSYVPHNHPQPETYFFKFDHPQGFGVQIQDNDAQVMHDEETSCIAPNRYHPNVGAPGYAMYYTWIIAHLPNNPWNKTRIYKQEHEWLLEPNPHIWKPQGK